MLRISPKYYDPEASGLTSWRIETESIPIPPHVIASSFTQSLPYLHNYLFGILLGVTMMCLLTQVIMLLIRFLLGLPRACRGVIKRVFIFCYSVLFGSRDNQYSHEKESKKKLISRYKEKVYSF